MYYFTEAVFADIFSCGSIRSVTVWYCAGTATIEYRVGDGDMGLIYTKRGEIKNYKIDTALRFLVSVGCKDAKIELRPGDDRQPTLWV